MVGVGGIYVQKNREVPDTYMTMIEYPGDYCHQHDLVHGQRDSVPDHRLRQLGHAPDRPGTHAGRGCRWATRARRGPAHPRPRRSAVIKAERQFLKEFKEANDGKTEVTIEPEASPRPRRQLAGLHAQPQATRLQRAQGLPGDGGHQARRRIPIGRGKS